MYCLSAEQLTLSRFAGASVRTVAGSEVARKQRLSAGPVNSVLCWEVVASIVLLITGMVRAQTPSTDPIERSIAFVDQSTEAVDLFNQGKYTDALTIFKSLVQSYPEQDTEGLAVLGMADTLAALGQIDEARATYESASRQNASLKQAVQGRLEELELKGSITDQLIERLRVQVKQGGDAAFVSSWRLGRALQKRALDLLTEATQTFRDAATSSSEENPRPVAQLLNHAAYLEELVSDLKFFIGEVEESFKLKPALEAGDPSPKPVTVEQHVQYVLKMPDGRQVTIQQDRDAGSKESKITIDDKDVKLTPAQLRLLQRHQDRIDAILLEAGQISPPEARAASK